MRLWRFSKGKRRCSAAEAESAFAEGKYFLALLENFRLQKNQKFDQTFQSLGARGRASD
jgi:hypothetical protein